METNHPTFYQHFYSIQGATAPTNTALIWAKALRRFAELSLRYEESISRMAREKQDRDKPFPKADKFNHNLEPLATLNSLYKVRWDSELYEELSRQELEKYIKYGPLGPPGGQPH
eukprot:scaffold7688_cov130-Isochrysis_galbana.AAC.13